MHLSFSRLFVLLFSYALFPLCNFIFNSMVAKGESTELFGELSLVVAVYAWLPLLIDFNTKDFYLSPKVVLSNKLDSYIGFLAPNVLAVLLCLFLFFKSALFYSVFLEYFCSAVLIKVLTLNHQLRKEERKIWLVSFIFALSCGVVKVLVYFYTQNVYLSYIISGLVAFTLLCTYLLFNVEFERKRYTFKQLAYNYREVLKLSSIWLPFFISGISFILYYSSDKILIEHFLGRTQLAIYAVATVFVSLGELFSMLLWTILLPRNKEIASSSIYQRILLFSVVVIALIAVVLNYIISEYLILYFFGESYALSVSILNILIFYFLFRYSNIILEICFVGMKKENVVAKYRVLSALVNLILNCIFIPIYGLYAAAVTTVFSELLLSCSIFIIFKRGGYKLNE